MNHPRDGAGVSRPALVKLGGSVLTDKARKSTFRRGTTKRLVAEAAKAGVPLVLLHGAGSFGHPQAAQAGIGRVPVDDRLRGDVSAVLAAVGRLHADVVALAEEAGLRPVSVPLHLTARGEGDQLVDVPVERIARLLEEGHTPVLSGTLVRDDVLGWRVASADEILQCLAEELAPRLALFVTDVDGVFDRHPEAPGAELLATVHGAAQADQVAAFAEGPGDDVTGRMRGKLLRAVAVAELCPVLVINGTVRGRLLEALKGKRVAATRVEAG